MDEIVDEETEHKINLEERLKKVENAMAYAAHQAVNDNATISSLRGEVTRRDNQINELEDLVCCLGVPV